MKCTKCGYESTETFAFCPICGYKSEQGQNSQQQPQVDSYSQYNTKAPISSVTERVLTMLKDNLFMVLCILFTVSTGTNLLNKDFSVINILMTIFLWLIFAQSRKGISDYKYMRFVSGTIFASYVIMWVIFSAFAFIGLICSVSIAAISGSGLLSDITSEMNTYLGEYAWLINGLASISAVFIGLFLIVIAVGGILINVFGLRSVHRFAQSLYQSVAIGQLNIVKRATAQTWLMVFGVIDAVFAVFSLFGGNFEAFLAGGCKAATQIIGSTLINKYFSDCM